MLGLWKIIGGEAIHTPARAQSYMSTCERGETQDAQADNREDAVERGGSGRKRHISAHPGSANERAHRSSG